MNNKELQTDLFEAIAAGNLRRVEVLLDMGVDIGVERLNSNVSSAPSYITPMQYALNKKDNEIISLIYKASGRNGVISEEDFTKSGEYFDAQRAAKLNPFQVKEEEPTSKPDLKVESSQEEKFVSDDIELASNKEVEELPKKEQEQVSKKLNKGAKR